MSENSEFQKLSELIAARFLQTVVVVDDQPVYRKSSSINGTSSSTKPTELKPPGRQKAFRSNIDASPEKLSSNAEPNFIVNGAQPSLSNEDLDTVSNQNLPKQEVISVPIDGQNEVIQTITTNDKFHELNVQELVSLFAEKGLVCSVISPEEDELDIVPKQVVTVARNADLVVLDWVLHKSIGDTTIEIIRGIIDSDEKYDGRLRTIVIYTGEKDIYGIADKVNKIVGGQLVTHAGECVVEKKGTLRIAVFAKDNVNIPPQYSNRQVPLRELPNKLIAEFSKITSGLVSNVALESLAILRDNTHLLLARLNSDIDIPFLTHRALLPRPDDSAEHLVDLIASEIRALLDEYDVERNANLDVVRQWLVSSERAALTYSLAHHGIQGELTSEQVLQLLSDGLEKWTVEGLSKNKKKDMFKHISQMLCSDETKARKLDDEFAMLTSLGRQNFEYGNKNLFRLTLGTILEQSPPSSDAEAYFWLCIQPRCNSARIPNERWFPLLPLQLVDGDSKFSLIVKDSLGNTIRLKLLDQAHHVNMVCFRSNLDRGGAVIAQPDDMLCTGKDSTISNASKHFFFTATDGSKYRWVADLKREHAQRIANDFASNLSRVGLNESEWLRLWGK